MVKKISAREIRGVFHDFCNQRRVGRHTIKHPKLRGRADFVKICRIDEKLHLSSLWIDLRFIEHCIEIPCRPAFPIALVVCITGNERHGNGSLGIDHLLMHRINLAP